jgi:hypothetical protein
LADHPPVSTEDFHFSPSRLVRERRTVQAYLSGEDFELRLLEDKTYITPRLIFTPAMLRQLEDMHPDRKPVQLGPLLIQRKHPEVLIYCNGELWMRVQAIEWGQLLGSQVMGSPMQIDTGLQRM